MSALFRGPTKPPISLKEFLESFQNTVKNLPQSEVEIQEKMNLLDDPERFQAIVRACDLSSLFEPNDFDSDEFDVTAEPKQRMKTEEPESAEVKETSEENRYSFHRSRESFKQVPPRPLKANYEIITPNSDVVVSIRVYRPTRVIHIGRSIENPVFAEEFQCLGSNTLAEFRDKINCVCNKYRYFDISENPGAPLPEKTTDPGFFFISDTFYDDNRNPDNIDYSDAICTWAENAAGLKQVEFKVAKMEETRFIDLTVSLGARQLYYHHGNCEHLFTFSQVEVFDRGSICQAREQYPYLRSYNVVNDRLCNMCGKRHNMFVVTGSKRQVHEPAYLCESCFYSYHYIDKKKIGEFEAYRIIDYHLNPRLVHRCKNTGHGHETLQEDSCHTSREDEDDSDIEYTETQGDDQ